MSFPIKIQSIIEELEMQFDESQTFLNKNTGEIVFVKLEDLRAAEDEEPFDHLPDWEQEERKIAIAVVENFEDYLGLPTKYDVNEYEIMEDYCLSVSDQVIRNKLLGAIKGKGAFRRFKEKIIDFGIEENWYSFRDNRFKEIAINWCKDNNIDFIE
ncbi:UPF0158 family protein [Bacillus sp. JJ1609]|uniref:UPF0158 family protein n=1 Tax=Bacillus sp. JJ1609 TaxID=3122977 RepID=UPI002FFE5A2A